LTGKSVLEVGCGRGGGLFYLQHAYTPKMMVGVDSNKVNIEFCTSVYGDERNLFFHVADPQNLFECKHLNVTTFDVILSI